MDITPLHWSEPSDRPATTDAASLHRSSSQSLPVSIGSEDETNIATNSLPDSILGNWSKIAQANMSVRLYADIVRIAMSGADSTGSSLCALQSPSLKSFLEFWSAIREEAAEPEIALAPDGALHAEWFKSRHERLDIRFADKKAIFGLITGKSILEGADNLTTVAQILKSHYAKPFLWSPK